MGIQKSKLAAAKKVLDKHVEEMNQYHVVIWAELGKLKKKAAEIEKKAVELGKEDESKAQAKKLESALKQYDKALEASIKVEKEFEKLKTLQKEIDTLLQKFANSKDTINKSEWTAMSKKASGVSAPGEKGLEDV